MTSTKSHNDEDQQLQQRKREKELLDLQKELLEEQRAQELSMLEEQRMLELHRLQALQTLQILQQAQEVSKKEDSSLESKTEDEDLSELNVTRTWDNYVLKKNREAIDSDDSAAERERMFEMMKQVVALSKKDDNFEDLQSRREQEEEGLKEKSWSDILKEYQEKYRKYGGVDVSLCDEVLKRGRRDRADDRKRKFEEVLARALSKKDDSSKELRCPKCGTLADPDDNFCTECGSKLKE